MRRIITTKLASALLLTALIFSLMPTTVFAADYPWLNEKNALYSTEDSTLYGYADFSRYTVLLNMFCQTCNYSLCENAKIGGSGNVQNGAVAGIRGLESHEGHYVACRLLYSNWGEVVAYGNRIVLQVQKYSNTPTPGYNFFLQTDSRWKNDIYAPGTSSMGDAACGLFSVKNAFYRFGINIPLDWLAQAAIDSGARSSGASGTDIKCLLTYTIDNYPGLHQSFGYYSGWSKDQAVYEIEKGGVVIANVLNQSNRPGHYLTLVDSNNGHFLVYDSAPSNSVGRGDIGNGAGTYVSHNGIGDRLCVDGFIYLYRK